MELTFEKIGDWYISEFEVTSDFNLHIEKEPKGDFYLYQRTSSSGQYDIIEDFGYKKGGDNVIDLDFQALVYPKWIKIKSAVKPLIATITTDGEVNEVSYQVKDIEITSNGTTKVTADTGYTALGSVNVKVNVPTEGGGSGDTMGEIYLDASVMQDSELGIDTIVTTFKRILDNGNIVFLPYGLANNPFVSGENIACMIYANAPISDPQTGEYSTLGESLLSIEASGKILPRITKEEFYNLNV